MTLNECLAAHAANLGVDNFIFILGDKPERAIREIDKFPFELLVKYSKLVEDDFKSFKEDGEVQYKSLIEILTEQHLTHSAMLNFLENAKYIVKLEFSAETTIQKINDKINSMKSLNQNKKKKIKNKLKTITYNEIITITKSNDALTNFLRG